MMTKKLVVLTVSFICATGIAQVQKKCDKIISTSGKINVAENKTHCVEKNITAQEIKLNGGTLIIKENATLFLVGNISGRKDKLSNFIIYGKLNSKKFLLDQLLVSIQLWDKGTLVISEKPAEELKSNLEYVKL